MTTKTRVAFWGATIVTCFVVALSFMQALVSTLALQVQLGNSYYGYHSVAGLLQKIAALCSAGCLVSIVTICVRAARAPQWSTLWAVLWLGGGAVVVNAMIGADNHALITRAPTVSIVLSSGADSDQEELVFTLLQDLPFDVAATSGYGGHAIELAPQLRRTQVEEALTRMRRSAFEIVAVHNMPAK